MVVVPRAIHPAPDGAISNSSCPIDLPSTSRENFPLSGCSAVLESFFCARASAHPKMRIRKQAAIAGRGTRFTDVATGIGSPTKLECHVVLRASGKIEEVLREANGQERGSSTRR